MCGAREKTFPSSEIIHSEAISRRRHGCAISSVGRVRTCWERGHKEVTGSLIDTCRDSANGYVGTTLMLDDMLSTNRDLLTYLSVQNSRMNGGCKGDGSGRRTFEC